MAEYEACILGLRFSIDMNAQELLVIEDSDMLVHQVLGEWATKKTKILSYLHCIQKLIKRFTKIEFKYVLRIQNEFADALSTFSSMIQHPKNNFIDPIPIGIHKQPAYYAYVEEEFDGNPWFHDIKKYLEKGEYPENATHTQKYMLRSDLVKTMCETFKINHQNFTVYMPQMNGAVEVANKNIKKILRKMVDNYKQLHEKLPFSLLEYRTTYHISTGATPYLLVFGTEVVIPTEVEIPSLRFI
ncbi:uncharacterized protein [Nicotiana tomentosiformis]|uniref:uncharacterized protein n=1 Tax=Nicotiana tomentosiformis TaxID=4098 RepID=UPI00388C9930